MQGDQAASRNPCVPPMNPAEFAPNRVAPRARILIVDDEANARMALAELLRDEGYAVETAADGFKALPKLEEFAPDLLLTDLKMPGMDGIELGRRARERDPE